LDDGIPEIILTLKFEMPNILIPVICSDPFIFDEFKCVISIIADQWIGCILKFFGSSWEESHSRRR